MSEMRRFTCARCGSGFLSEASDEEAEAEAVAVFGAVPADPAVLCDACYVAFVAWAHRNAPEAFR